MKSMRKPFGRKNVLPRPDVAGAPFPASSRPFGRRGSNRSADIAPDRSIPAEVVEFAAVARLRLAGIYRDLLNLYSDPVHTGDAPNFELCDDPSPRLLIGNQASVTIDATSAQYVLLLDGREGARITVETGSEDVLVDHIIGHLALDRGRYFSGMTYGVVSTLVGRSLAEVERSPIFATLRRYHFNRAHAGEVLGISQRTIRSKLRSYRQDVHKGAPSAVFPSIDNKTADSPRTEDVRRNPRGDDR